MQTLFTPEARQQAAQRFAPLAQEQRTHVDTAAAAHYLNRRPQTLRGWHCHGAFPTDGLRPLVINSRLAWNVAAIKSVMGGGVIMTTKYTTSEKGYGCDPVPFQKHTTNDLDFPTSERKAKAISTLTAQLALHGHAVHDGLSGDFLVCRWGMSKYCQDFDELQAFAVKLGIAPC